MEGIKDGKCIFWKKYMEQLAGSSKSGKIHLAAFLSKK